MSGSPPTKPIPIHNNHHKVRNLPLQINEYIDYVPVAKSLNDTSIAQNTCKKLDIKQELNNTIWQPDDASMTCYCCKKPFHSLWRRRHHCRVCGFLVCGSCSSFVSTGFAHYKKNKLIQTSLDISVFKPCTKERVCTDCTKLLNQLQHAYKIAMALSILVKYHPHISHQQNIFNLFSNLKKINKCFYIACSQLKKLLVSSQYIYGHPWNLNFKNKNSIHYIMTHNLLCAMEPYLKNHDFYEYALQYYKIPTSNSNYTISCTELLCRNCSHTKSMEIDMTNLFFNDSLCEWNLDLAYLLTPTLLWKKKTNCIEQLINKFDKSYIPLLFTWLHAFPFGAGYVNKIKVMIPQKSWSILQQEFDFFHRLCEVARTCKSNIHDKRFAMLAKEIAKNPYRLPGYPMLEIVELDVFSNKFKQAKSSSKPFMLPCKIFHLDTQSFTKDTLLIKHKQSMGSDGFVHLYIQYLKSIANNAETIQTYPSIPIGSYAGIIVMVKNSFDLSELTKTSTIQNKLYDDIANINKSRDDINRVFANSVAFFTTLTCFIGLRDRIESNMMIATKTCTLFHIDFEYMFSKQPPLKETIRNMSNAVGDIMQSFIQTYSSKSKPTRYRATSSSHFLELNHDDTIVMTPLLPDSVMSMLGGHGSWTYNKYFVPQFNYFFQLMWNQRHVLYFASQYLVFFPSTTQASQLTTKEHDTFFMDLATIVLKGSNTYGEFACKVTMDKHQKQPWTEKLMTKISDWKRK